LTAQLPVRALKWLAEMASVLSSAVLVAILARSREVPVATALEL